MSMVIMLAGCEPASVENKTADTAAYSGKVPELYTVNYPLQYFAQRIGGALVSTRYPGPVGADPAYWSPDVETVIDYQQADLIILNGAGYAGWVKKVSLPLARQIDTTAAFTELLLPVTDKVVHTHGPAGEHVHDDLVFTVWLDPELAKQQTAEIHAAVATLLPEQAAALESNMAALEADLQQLDAELRRVFNDRGNTRIIYSHPVYQYLDRRYELDGMSVHWEPGELPSDKDFTELANMSGAIMLWEAEPLSETGDRLAKMGIKSVVFDPCATEPESGDYLDTMRANLQRLSAALP